MCLLQRKRQLRVVFILYQNIGQAVRFAGGEVGDQVRVTTPAKAREIGSDFIVVGRPITAAEDPVAAYRKAVAEFVG